MEPLSTALSYSKLAPRPLALRLGPSLTLPIPWTPGQQHFLGSVTRTPTGFMCFPYRRDPGGDCICRAQPGPQPQKVPRKLSESNQGESRWSTNHRCAAPTSAKSSSRRGSGGKQGCFRGSRGLRWALPGPGCAAPLSRFAEARPRVEQTYPDLRQPSCPQATTRMWKRKLRLQGKAPGHHGRVNQHCQGAVVVPESDPRPLPPQLAVSIAVPAGQSTNPSHQDPQPPLNHSL